MMTCCKIRRSFIENFQTNNKLSICYKHYCRLNICQLLKLNKKFLFVKNKIVCQSAKSHSFYLSKTRLCAKAQKVTQFLFVKNKIDCQSICQSLKTQTDAEIKKNFLEGVESFVEMSFH